MLKRLLFVLFGFLFFAPASFGQAYEPGLLVRANGDTLRGEIENGFWVEPPAFIRFRPTPESPSQLFQPRQLRAVNFTRGRYFRYEALPIDHAAETRIDRLPVGNKANVVVDSLLAEVLVEGQALLFRVALLSATHYLISRPGRPLLDLSARLYQIEARTRGYTDGNNYRGQLGIYFGDCSAASAAARMASFTAKELVAVVQQYNEKCSVGQRAGQSWLEQAAPRRKVALQGGLLAGGRYNYAESSYPTRTCIDCRFHPFAGLYSELFLPSRAAAIYGELSSGTFRSQGLQLARFTYLPFAYRAWLHTARLGMRFFFALPHEQQWLLGLSYELNAVSNRSGVPDGNAPDVLVNQEFTYGTSGLIPNIGIGWRRKGVTAFLDGQSYYGLDDVSTGSSSGKHFSLRIGLGYRLGRNPDNIVSPKSTAP